MRKIKSLIFVIFLLLIITDTKAQEVYVGAGLNHISDRLYLNSSTYNLGVGIIYHIDESPVFYEINYIPLSKDHFSLPVIMRKRGTNKLSFCPGLGLNFWNFDNDLEVGIGGGIGFSYALQKLTFCLSGSYFFDLTKQSYQEIHPGGTIYKKEHNNLISINLLIYHKAFRLSKKISN